MDTPNTGRAPFAVWLELLSVALFCDLASLKSWFSTAATPVDSEEAIPEFEGLRRKGLFLFC